MKKYADFILFFVGAITAGLTGYYYGCLKTLESPSLTNMETIITNKISDRYLKVYGSPKNQDEQCKFDFVVYADSTECK